jgi:hypothetical protein
VTGLSLQEFYQEALAANRRRLLASGYQPRLDVTWKQEHGIFESRAPQPDEEDLRSLLIDLRLFWAKREPYYLPKVYRAARQAVSAPELLERLEASERRHTRLEGLGTYQQAFRLPDGSTWTLTNRELADWWMHGAYFHRKNTRQTRWWRGMDPMGRTIIEQGMREYVLDYLGEVFEVANVLMVAGAVRAS